MIGEAGSVMRANVFGSVKALNDVGKDLPTRVGDSEPNRLKNRYPSIVPCKCKTRTMLNHVCVHIY